MHDSLNMNNEKWIMPFKNNDSTKSTLKTRQSAAYEWVVIRWKS